MANNRMFLVHTPTGLAAKLGNRMGYGWYIRNQPEEIGDGIEKLFAQLESDEYPGGQDQFEIIMEDGTESPSTKSFVYGDAREDGLYNLIISEEKR